MTHQHKMTGLGRFAGRFPRRSMGRSLGRRQKGQRGVAMLLTMIVMASLLLGGIVATGMRMANLRASGQSLASKRAYYCAEAGVDAGRDFFRANQANWNAYLAANFVLTGQASTTGLTYGVRIVNDDDSYPNTNPAVDVNGTVILTSTCTDSSVADPVVLTQVLTTKPLNGQASGLPVSTGAVTYASTAAFTNNNAMPTTANVAAAAAAPGGNGNGSMGGGGGGTPGNLTVGGAGYVAAGYIAAGYSGIASGAITALGVNLANNQIALAATGVPNSQFIWVANQAEGTVSKINISTGVEASRIRIGGATAVPTGTAVDLNGDVWVANQGDNSITKIGLNEAGDCVDRNSNGVIDTSTGAADVKAWTNPSAAGVVGAADECVIQHVLLTAPNTTTPSGATLVLVDRFNNVFAGGIGGPGLFYVNGANGTILAGVDTLANHAFGAIDRDGYIWSIPAAGSNNIEKIAPDFSGSTLYPITQDNEAIALATVQIDLEGLIWTSEPASRFMNMWTDGSHLNVYTQQGNACCGTGAALDGSGNYYLADDSVGQIEEYLNSGSYLSAVTTTGVTPVGLSFDQNGLLWTATSNGATVPGKVAAYNLGAATSASYAAGLVPIINLDPTGNFLRNVTAPQGTWTVYQYCGSTCPSWQSITWLQTTPTGTSVTIRARSGATLAALRASPWMVMTSAVTLPISGAGSLSGPYIEVEVRLTSTVAGVTPSVNSLTISPWL